MLPRTVLAGSLIGFALYAAVQSWAISRSGTPYIGEFVYNYYFLSILDHRLDVPVQIIGLEGHYTGDGRAFVYHGLAPLLTRLAAYPFVDLTVTDLRPLTIWMFAGLGSAAFHALLVGLLRPVWPERPGRLADAAIWGLVWITGPGLILVSNGSFFHEPIAVAFAALGCFLFALFHLFKARFHSGLMLVAMAVPAALAVHSRPHVAVGMYAILCFAALIVLRRNGRAGLVPVAAAMAIVLASGVLYLKLNELRFGSVTAVDGSLERGSGVVYGFVYWNFEEPDSDRFRTATEAGRFNALRVIPNFVMYLVSMGDRFSVDAFERLTQRLGEIRLEFPMIGMLFLWPAWIVLSVVGMFRRGFPRQLFWAMLMAVLPGVLLVYAYPTVSMRYRVELWPLFFVLGASALVALTGAQSNDFRVFRQRLVFGVVAGALTGALMAYLYSDFINWKWGTVLRSYEDCRYLVSGHPGLGVDRVTDLCMIGAP